MVKKKKKRVDCRKEKDKNVKNVFQFMFQEEI